MNSFQDYLPNCEELSEKSGAARVVRQVDRITKFHSASTDPRDLGLRLHLITQPSLLELFVQPISSCLEELQNRLVTRWPLGIPAEFASIENVDWEGDAKLLAALHQVPVALVQAGCAVPSAGWLPRLRRSYLRLLGLKNSSPRRQVLAAFATLPGQDDTAWQMGSCLIHGDWHPGQVVFLEGRPRLVDIDDVGFGNPAWDLARPAAWHLAGLLPEEVWSRFHGSYRDAGGPGIDAYDPWLKLELPARAGVVQAAAAAVTRAEQESRSLEDFEIELVNTCKRIVSVFAHMESV